MILGFTYSEFIFNLVFYSEICVFLNFVLTPRYKPGKMLLLYILLVFSIFLPVGLFKKMSLIRAMLIPVMVMLYNLFIFRDSLVRRIFYAWLVFAIMLLTELLTIAIVYNPHMLGGSIGAAPVQEQLLCWGTELVIAAVLYWIAALVLNKTRGRFKLREILMYIFFPISQCFLLFAWMQAAWEYKWDSGQQNLLLAVALVCLIADAGLFASMLRVSRQMELEQENRLLAARIEAQREHYTALTEQYEAVRRMRHDIDKHVSALDMLIASGDMAQAGKYAAELIAEYECGVTNEEREVGL